MIKSEKQLLEENVQGKTNTVKLDDFELLSIIGVGSYAKVALVKKKDSGELFALKILKKEYIEKKNQIQHIMTERNILSTISHPFIVSMKYAFQTEKRLYMALEFCPGGELFNLLSKKRRLSEQEYTY